MKSKQLEQEETTFDRQCEYASVGAPDHYGFLSHGTVERIDQVAEKRTPFIADC